jgi:hypothetical protein
MGQSHLCTMQYISRTASQTPYNVGYQPHGLAACHRTGGARSNHEASEITNKPPRLTGDVSLLLQVLVTLDFAARVAFLKNVEGG